MNDNDKEIELIPDEENAEPEEKYNKLHDKLKICETERKEYLDGWQRTKADHINYRNDEGKRMEDIGRFITAGLIEEFLPVLDSFDLAQNHGVGAEVERGILLIRSQFEDILKKRGVEIITVQKGDAFKPERHESMGEMQSDAPEGTIAREVQKGYMFRGKVIRPARVQLSK